MSEERLYQPDFSCVFGKDYSNAFLYGQVDSLVFPIFSDVDMSKSLQNLLKLKNLDKRELFYRRKITVEDFKVELNCSNIDYALIQAIDLGRDYGIENQDIINVIKKEPNQLKAILSFNLSNSSSCESSLSTLKKLEKDVNVAGIVIYPSYTNLDLSTKKDESFNNFINYCVKQNYFIKIDVGNLYLPEDNAELTSYKKIRSFLSNYPEPKIILSGLDISFEFELYYQLVKYFNNLWLEIDPRSFGGMTPTECFKKLFSVKGFIQNCWHRITIGSATPSLEISQMIRGFIEATELLSFSQKCLLRTWTFRNINRLNRIVFKPSNDLEPDLFKTIINIEEIKAIKSENEIEIDYKIKLRSYSITQLVYLSDLIKEIFNKTLEKNPNAKNGEFFIRSYHTTTSLILNEHEIGNYLDLHYMFAEASRKDSSVFLHTTKALENRADFNHYDHELASTYGSRQLNLPIIDRKLEIGNRENFYILVTFGPRTFNIIIRIKMNK